MLTNTGWRCALQAGPIGAASAMKMSYAGITKGFTALGAAMMLAATRGGTRRGAARGTRRQPAGAVRLADAAGAEDVFRKPIAGSPRWRRSPPSPARTRRRGALFAAAAQFYERIAADFDGEGKETRRADANSAGRHRRSHRCRTASSAIPPMDSVIYGKPFAEALAGEAQRAGRERGLCAGRRHVVARDRCAGTGARRAGQQARRRLHGDRRAHAAHRCRRGGQRGARGRRRSAGDDRRRLGDRCGEDGRPVPRQRCHRGRSNSTRSARETRPDGTTQRPPVAAPDGALHRRARPRCRPASSPPSPAAPTRRGR